jgi:nickel/cobalt exporter
MAVGTGLTVSALATLAVVARDAALRVTSRRSAAIAVLGRTIEIGGALAVLLLGLLLLGGAISASA